MVFCMPDGGTRQLGKGRLKAWLVTAGVDYQKVIAGGKGSSRRGGKGGAAFVGNHDDENP
jgi:hypothetical protein